MKKILILIFLLLPVLVQAQTLYLTGDGSVSGNKKGTDYHFINPGVYKTFGEKERFGVFVEATIEPEAWSIAPGVYFTFKTDNETYQEFGGGPGFEYEKDGSKLSYLNTYYYLETRSDEIRDKGKIIVSNNFSYSKKWDQPLWHQVFVVIYPFNKWFGVGLHSQSYAVDGIRVQGTLGWKTGLINSYFIIGLKSRFQVGMNYSISFHRKG